MKTNNTPAVYFALSRNYTEDNQIESVDAYIFGDIASNRGGLAGLLQASSDQSSYDLATQLSDLPAEIPVTVHINSNGGEVKEGLAIYNVLKERGNVTTICEGFAASAASIIFCGGSTRIMQPASLLFIHQASMTAEGNSDDFEKAAEDLKIITAAAVNAYKEAGVNVSDEELSAMLKAETWILPEDAVRMGFATKVSDEEENEKVPKNDAVRSFMAMVSAPKKAIGSINVSIEGIEELKALTESVEEQFENYQDLLTLASKALAGLEANPELYGKVKAFASTFFATNPTPNPAKVGNKGFFNFN